MAFSRALDLGTDADLSVSQPETVLFAKSAPDIRPPEASQPDLGAPVHTLPQHILAGQIPAQTQPVSRVAADNLTGPILPLEPSSAGQKIRQMDQLVSAYADRLKVWNCLRLRVGDRKSLAIERTRVTDAAHCLGRRVYTSYRYPYLYVRLGERIINQSRETVASAVSLERERA